MRLHDRVAIRTALVAMMALPLTTALGLLRSESTSADPPVHDVLMLQQFTPTARSTWWAVMESSVVSRSYVFRTSDAGQSWRDLSPTKLGLGSTYFLNSDVGWAVAQVPRPPAAVLFRTMNAGRSWQRLGSAPTDCELEFVDRDHGWCTVIAGAAGSEGVEIYRTADGGVTWGLVSKTDLTSTANPPGSLPGGCDKTLTFTSPQIGWASYLCNGGTAPLFKTSDGGNQWTPLYPRSVQGDNEFSYGESLGVPTVAGSHIAVAVHYGQPQNTEIASSTDEGATWTLHQVPGGPRYWSSDLIDQRHWVLNDGQALLATNDGGTSWHSSTPKINLRSRDGTLLTLRYLSPHLGWTVPDVNGGTMWWTSDSGGNWKLIQLPGQVSL